MRVTTVGQQVVLDERRDARVTTHCFMTPRVEEILQPWRMREPARRTLADGELGLRETR